MPSITPYSGEGHRSRVEKLRDEYLKAPRPSSDEEIAAEKTRMEKILGQPRDQSQTLAEIARLEGQARQQMQPNTGRTLFDMGTALLANQSPYAGVAFGQAAQHAMGQHQARTEQGRENLMQALQARSRIDQVVDAHKMRVNEAVQKGLEQNQDRSQRFNEMLYTQGVGLENADEATKQKAWQMEQESRNRLNEASIAAMMGGMTKAQATSIVGNPNASPAARDWAQKVLDKYAEQEEAAVAAYIKKQEALMTARNAGALQLAIDKKAAGIGAGKPTVPKGPPVTDMQTTARALIHEQMVYPKGPAASTNEAKDRVVRNLKNPEWYRGDPIIDTPGGRERMIKYVEGAKDFEKNTNKYLTRPGSRTIKPSIAPTSTIEDVE